MTAISFPINSSAFISVGNCPVQIQATTVACKAVVADSQPSIGTSGTVLNPNTMSEIFVPADASSQCWVASLGGTSVVAALALTGPLGSGGGGGSGVTFTDGTNTVANATQLAVTGGTIGGATPNGTLTISGGGSLLSAAVTLTSAQILSMGTSPVTIVPAISGKVSFVLGVNFDYGFVSADYTGTRPQVSYSGHLAGFMARLTAWPALGEPVTAQVPLSGITFNNVTTAALQNTAIVATTTDSSNPTGGDSTLTTTVWYVTF